MQYAHSIFESNSFGMLCASACLFIYLLSNGSIRLIAFVLLCEFALHEISYQIVSQIDWLFKTSFLLFLYGAINIAAIYIISLTKSHFAITTLIFINLGYNMLSASQYVFNTYDFISLFVDVVGVIMVLEISLLLWMAASDRYNTKFNGSGDINTFNNGFYPRISIPIRGLF